MGLGGRGPHSLALPLGAPLEDDTHCGWVCSLGWYGKHDLMDVLVEKVLLHLAGLSPLTLQVVAPASEIFLLGLRGTALVEQLGVGQHEAESVGEHEQLVESSIDNLILSSIEFKRQGHVIQHFRILRLAPEEDNDK